MSCAFWPIGSTSRRFASNDRRCRAIGRRAYLRHQARLMEEAERYWCERVALNVAVSEHDRASLECMAPGSRIAVVPNGVDVAAFHPDATWGTGVAFVGGLHWFPNREAL